MVSFNSRYSFTSKIFEVDLVKYKAVNGEYLATFIDGKNLIASRIRFVQVRDVIIHIFFKFKIFSRQKYALIGMVNKAHEIEILKRFLVNDSTKKGANCPLL